MTIEEATRRLEDHFAVHDDGRPTPYLDEAVRVMFESLNKYDSLMKNFSKQVRDGLEPRDLYDAGFESGIHWAFYFLRHNIKATMTDADIVKLASWFELKLPWKDLSGWYNLMQDAIKW